MWESFKMLKSLNDLYACAVKYVIYFYMQRIVEERHKIMV